PPDGSALILSLRRMNNIRALSADNRLAVAEAGVILEQLHGAAHEAGMRFPLTLGARGSCTIGGLTSTNAGGTQVLKFGTMRALDLLRFLEARTGSVEGFELVPQDTLELVLKHIPGTRSPLSGKHPWHVLVEATTAEAERDISAELEQLLGAAQARLKCL